MVSIMCGKGMIGGSSDWHVSASIPQLKSLFLDTTASSMNNSDAYNTYIKYILKGSANVQIKSTTDNNYYRNSVYNHTQGIVTQYKSVCSAHTVMWEWSKNTVVPFGVTASELLSNTPNTNKTTTNVCNTLTQSSTNHPSINGKYLTIPRVSVLGCGLCSCIYR